MFKLARLARLDLTEEEAELYRTQLHAILQYVDQLTDVDVKGLEPTVQVGGLKNVMRDDEVVDYGISHEELLRLAPKTQDGQIKVKRMIK